jgi:hypothetical protein
MEVKMPPAKRDERSAKTGEYVKRGTEKRDPGHTVTEPTKKKK